MNKKYLAYTIVPAIAVVLLGAGVASAHGWFGGLGFGSPEEITERMEGMFQENADILGISIDEIKNAWSEGKTFREIAEEQGITQEELQERMRGERREQVQNRLQLLVDNGVITQEQANQRFQMMEERCENGGALGGFHRGGGRGFMR